MQSLIRPIARPAVASRFMRAAWAPAARGVRPLTQSKVRREPASAAQAANVEAEVARTPAAARARPSPTGIPLNIKKWVEENAEKLAPPVNNYCVYDGSGVTVMIVGGPNQRTDYHINETPEWFYQHKGTMVLRVKDMSDPGYDELGQGFDIRINEGDMYLLPPNTPHNPVRFKDTVGIVIEQGRPKDSIDKLRWYCNSCGESIVHEASFHCTDLGTQIKDGVRKFEALDEQSRTCKSCGTVCESKYNEDDLLELQRGGPAYCYKH